mgnify:CR=1 FL=1
MSARVALITGGTRGIGLGIARALAADGWSLALCGMREPDAVATTVEDLRAGGAPEVAYWRADVSSRDDRSRLMRGIETRFARLDALGEVQKKLCLVRLDSDEPVAAGEPLIAGGKEVGKLTSVAPQTVDHARLALANMRRGSFAVGTQFECRGISGTVIEHA